jgi:hypothetical protein
MTGNYWKNEALIPHNNNAIFSTDAPTLHKQNFFNPEHVRWELHRVWVVQAALHPGECNVLARRIFYLDEDTSMVGINDSWDSAGNLTRVEYNVNANFPNLPSTIYMNTITYTMQTENYVSNNGSYGNIPYNQPWRFVPLPADMFAPQAMAATASY